MAGKKRSETKDRATGSFMFTAIPVVLRKKFRAWCELRGITMHEKALDMIRNCLREKDLGVGGMRQEEEPGKRSYMLFEKVPNSLRCHFRAWCALRNIDMRDKFMSMMRECIKDSRGVP